MFEIKQQKSRTPITENRLQTEKLDLDRPECDISVDDDIEEIRRTWSHQSDIHIE